MAKNKVNVDVQVDDNGTLKSLDKNAKAAAAGLNKTATAAGTADRNLKGAAQASSNGTKNFSKMAQGIEGGLVPAYATLAANVFAITAAFQFFKQAGDLAILRDSQVEYANQTGRSMRLLTAELQSAARGMLSFEDAAQGAAIGAAAGLSNSQLEGLADVAYRASVALGRDLTDSFNRLTRGAIKAEPELLDELGIIIRLDTVTKDYARTLGTTAQSLTAFQRTQAVTNAILDQADTKFQDLGENVNQVARLGKAFESLLRDIQEFFQPIVNFVGKVLADNVVALAGAFALLGAPLLSALTPAAPAFTNIKESADAAVLSLSRYADESSKTGKKLKGAKSFDDLSDKELNYIEGTANAKSSTIIKYDNKSRAAIVKNINIVKAQRKLLEAETKTGVKRTYAMWKAELALLQAQHGKVMGSMKAGMIGFSRVANKALGAIGFIGLITTAIAMVQELLDKLKDPALEKFRQNLTEAEAKTNAQVAEFERLGIEMKLAANESERLFQNANRLSNINFNHLKGIQLPTMEVGRGDEGYDADVGRTFSAMALRTRNFVESQKSALIQQRNAVASIIGEDAPEILNFDKSIADLDGAILKIRQARAAGLAGDKDTANLLMAQASLVLQQIPSISQAVAKPIIDAKTALEGLGQQGDSFLKFQDTIKQTPSKFDNILTQVAQFSQSVETGMIEKIKTVNDLTDKQRASLELILGDLEGRITKEQVLQMLAKKRADILKVERTLEREKFEMQQKFAILMGKATPLRMATLQNLKQQANLQLQIKSIYAEHKVQNLANLMAGDSKMKQDAERVILLQTQLDLLKQQATLAFQIEQAFLTGLENSMKGQLSALIKGEESSFTDAVKQMAKASLESIADVLATRMTEDLMSFIPGYETPEQKILNAMQAGADYTRQAIIDGFKGGATGTPVGMRTPRADSLGEYLSDNMDSVKKKAKDVQKLFEGSSSAEGVFEPFVDSLNKLFSGDAPFLKGLGDVFTSGLQGFDKLLGSLLNSLFSSDTSGGLFATLFSLGASAATGAPVSESYLPDNFRYGGYTSGKIPQANVGGVLSGPQAGYPVMMHGTEAVVPLPNGKEIPVQMQGNSGGVNNVSVSVNIDNSGKSETQTNGNADGAALGKAVAAAVQEELKNQKRSGGILNPYGVA